MIKISQGFIAVVGGGECSPEVARLADEVGQEIAHQGAVLVCGGLGGVMEAACRGAKSAGGLTVGILPGTSREDANPYVDIPVVTGMGYARNVIVVRSAQAVIAIDGSYGTLSEIAHAVSYNIPVIGLGTWTFSINGTEDTSLLRANSPKEAVKIALAAARKLSSRHP